LHIKHSRKRREGDKVKVQGKRQIYFFIFDSLYILVAQAFRLLFLGIPFFFFSVAARSQQLRRSFAFYTSSL
jgi:uncharacterized protein YqjF (DUF2071 family)